MAVELATGYISLVPSAKGIGRNLARELNGPLVDAGRKAGDDSSAAFGGRFTAGLKSAAKSAGIALGVAFGAAGTYGVKVAADFQQTRIAFEGILGSAEAADKQLRDLQQFAAGTPFEFAGLAESAQQLLAVGFTAEDIIPTMTTLGNVAATLGVGEAEIKGVVRALGQMRGKGKASAEELQQISEQIPGFSAISAIAEDMGITTAEAFKLLEKGAIPADAAIESILNGMEAFPGAAGAMERQSKTLNGVLSTFKDTLNIALIQGIEPFLPAISGALTSALPVIETFVTGTIGGVAAVVTGFTDMGRAIGGFISEVSKGDIGAGIAVEVGKLVGLAEDHPLVSTLASALGAVGDAAGAAFDALSGMASFVSSEVSGAVSTAAGAWAVYARDGVGPVATAFDSIKTSAGDVNQFLREQTDILVPLGIAAGALAAAFAAFQVVEGVQVAIASFNLLAPAITGAFAPLLANPVGLAIAAIVAIGAAFAAAYFKIQPFRDAVDTLVDVIGEFAVKAGAFVSDLVDDAIPVIEDFASTVADIGRTIGRAFTTGFRAIGRTIDRFLIEPLQPLAAFLTDEVFPAFSAFGEFVGAVLERVGQVVGPAVKIFTAQLRLFAGVVSDLVGPAFSQVAAIVTAAVDIIGTAIRTIANVLAPVLGTAFDAAAAAIDVAFGIITSIFQAFFNTVEGIFDVLTGIVSGDFGKVWEGLTEIIGAPIRAARDIIVNTFEEVIGFIGGIPARLGDFVSAMFSGAVDTATSIVEGVRDIVTTTFDGIVTFVTGLPGRIADAASGMWDGIAEAFESAVNFIIGAWNSLEFSIPGFDPPGPGPKFGGITIGVPKIDPVDFASGGIVMARPGGTLARIGEAGRNEAVVPLPPNFDIASGGLGGALVGGDLNVLQMPGEDSVITAMRELRRMQLLVA